MQREGESDFEKMAQGVELFKFKIFYDQIDFSPG